MANGRPKKILKKVFDGGVSTLHVRQNDAMKCISWRRNSWISVKPGDVGSRV